MTATRTVPNIFPPLYVQESYTRKTVKASLFRKFAMAQNYLWSRLRRIYAMGGHEGNGTRIYRINSNFPQNRQNQEAVPPIAANANVTTGVPLVTFLVPPNWCGSQRVVIQGRTNFKTGAGSKGYIIAVLQKLDGTVVTSSYVEYTATDETNKVFLLSVTVPQDDLYQMRVYIAFVDGSSGTENGYSTEYIEVKEISARYAVANAYEMGGDTPPATWSALADFFLNDYPVASVFLKKLTQNTQHLYAYRPPELCQTWLGNPWHNTSTFTEIGRYIIWTPSKVTELKGKLVIYCTNGGAGNEVRVLLNGVVKETFTALGTGETLKDLAAITVTENQENTITIEAKSTAASANWGTIVWGVTMWESAVTLGLPSGTTVPTNYQPLDEQALEGDDVITAEDLNAYAQRAGLRRLFDNDRWLAANRLRWVISDWRHGALKRCAFQPDAEPDPRADWTPDEWTTLTGGYAGADHTRNITIRGSESGDDDVDGYGLFPSGLATTQGGDSAGPYHYPSTLTYTLHGRRLGKWSMIRPASVRTHADDLGGLRAMFRARRVRPLQMSTDTLGYGPTPEEAQYVGKGRLEFLWGSTKYDIPITGVFFNNNPASTVAPTDCLATWLPPVQMAHSAADQTYKVRGRLPTQPLVSTANTVVWAATHVYGVGAHVSNGGNIYECTQGGTSAGAGGPTGTGTGIVDNTCKWNYVNPATGRPEGMLFEIEVLSVSIMDEPLDAALLLASPYS